jgi:hypothetical protein
VPGQALEGGKGVRIGHSPSGSEEIQHLKGFVELCFVTPAKAGVPLPSFLLLIQKEEEEEEAGFPLPRE